MMLHTGAEFMRRRISEEKKDSNAALIKQQALLFQEYLKQ